jgi:hypothetical protein
LKSKAGLEVGLRALLGVGGNSLLESNVELEVGLRTL